jgi:hypothetical protein
MAPMNVLSSFIDWLSVGEYHRAKNESVRAIVAKQSRGNISAQNGFVLNADQMLAQSIDADRKLQDLQRMIEQASKHGGARI